MLNFCTVYFTLSPSMCNVESAIERKELTISKQRSKSCACVCEIKKSIKKFLHTKKWVLSARPSIIPHLFLHIIEDKKKPYLSGHPAHRSTSFFQNDEVHCAHNIRKACPQNSPSHFQKQAHPRRPLQITPSNSLFTPRNSVPPTIPPSNNPIGVSLLAGQG